MNKRVKTIFYIVSFGLMLWAFIYLGAKDYSKDVKAFDDGVNFSNEYSSVPKDNIFKYIKILESVEIFEDGTGIIYIADPNYKWSDGYSKVLYEFSLENNIDEIYYLNISKDRMQRSSNYDKLLNAIKSGIVTTSYDDKMLLTPCIYFVKNGHVIAYDNSVSIMDLTQNPDDYWTTYAQYSLKEKLREYYTAYKEK